MASLMLNLVKKDVTFSYLIIVKVENYQSQTCFELDNVLKQILYGVILKNNTQRSFKGQREVFFQIRGRFAKK